LGRVKLHRGTVVVVVVGVIATAVLAIGTEISYRHSQHRLASLQTRLTADALGAAPIDFERRLGPVAGVAANSADPVRAFRRGIASSMKPSGPFASASLIRLHGGRATLLAHLGVAPLRRPTGPVATALFRRAATSHQLVTTRAVGRGIQKLGYMVAASGSAGTFVVGGAQALPQHYLLPVPADSPDIGLNIAIYFGRTTTASTLVGSTSAQVPSGSGTSKAVVPFGTNKLTLVASPRTALAGTLSARLPWAVIAAGLAMTILVALLAERLIRRELGAESLAAENDALYHHQRDLAVTLQRALLPQDFPAIDGVECAGAYLPGATGTEVGGDWYSVVHSDRGRTYFVVGDISGRGVEAAALMAQLRFTIRTLATLDHDPADILRRASTDIDFDTSGRFATVIVGVIDDDLTLRIASAGHPPPLLTNADRAEYLTIRPGPPLGLGSFRYETVDVSLAPGSTVIAFTDGLIETRGAGIDEGLERLRRASTPDGSRDVDGLVEAIIDALIPSGSEDDVALLALRFITSRQRAAIMQQPLSPAGELNVPSGRNV
jgi:serine phosphatase RsbU (regulator of sigma subunit)